MISDPQLISCLRENQLLEERDMSQSNITVIVRSRPLNQKELQRSEKEIIQILDNKIVLLFDQGFQMNQSDILRKNRNKVMQYAYDYAFGKDADQYEIYKNSAQPLIKSIYEGYNGTVFAYGATGAGKTHTMIGGQENIGIMERSIDDLFKIYSQQIAIKDINVKASYIEIYNEQIKDLLTQKTNRNLELREDPQQGVVVIGITEIDVKNTSEILNLFKVGNKNRTIESTQDNEVSSRSHAILQVQLQIKDKMSDINQEIQCSKLCLVDLAGSERAPKQENRGIRFLESAKINQSLLALGNCIQALSEASDKGIKNAFISYRDSKLTRLLKDSLGGNCRTVMIANVSPSIFSFEETYNTLNYANRAKKIKTQTSRNYVNRDDNSLNYSNLIDYLKKENEDLKKLLYNKASSIPTEEYESYPLFSYKSKENTKQSKSKIENDFHQQIDMKQNLFSLRNSIQDVQSLSTSLEAEQYKKINLRESFLQIEGVQNSSDKMNLSINSNSKNNLHVSIQKYDNTLDNQILLTEQEKLAFFNSVKEFQSWLKEYLQNSGIKNFIDQLEQLMQSNSNDINNEEFLQDFNFKQQTSISQVLVDNIKEYLISLMEFNKYSEMVIGSKDFNLKNENEQLNSQIYSLKQELIKKDVQIIDYRNQVKKEIKSEQNCVIDQKDKIISELSQLVDQYKLKNQQYQTQIEQMEQNLQISEEDKNNLNQYIANLLNEINKLRQKVNNNEYEQKEINENLLKMQERSEEYINKLQNEIESLCMENCNLQEELQKEFQKYFIIKDEYQIKKEKNQNLLLTLEQQNKLIEDLQYDQQEKQKQLNLLYKNFQIEKELLGSSPLNNLWNFIQNLITDIKCEKDQKSHFIEEMQGLCLYEQSMLYEKSEKILLECMSQYEENFVNLNSINETDSQQMLLNQTLKKEFAERNFNKEQLTEYISSLNQQLSAWNLISKQIGGDSFKTENTQLITTMHSKSEDNIYKNQSPYHRKFKESSKLSHYSEDFVNKSQNKSPTSQIQQLNTIKEYNMSEQQKIDAIQLLLTENKKLCQTLQINLEELDKLKVNSKLYYEVNDKLKKEMQTKLNKVSDELNQKQAEQRQQITQIIQFDINKQNMEEEINHLQEQLFNFQSQLKILKEENLYLKQVQSDNLQKLEEFQREKDEIEDQCFYYELQSRNFQELFKIVSKENEKYKEQLIEQKFMIDSLTKNFNQKFFSRPQNIQFQSFESFDPLQSQEKYVNKNDGYQINNNVNTCNPQIKQILNTITKQNPQTQNCMTIKKRNDIYNQNQYEDQHQCLQQESFHSPISTININVNLTNNDGKAEIEANAQTKKLDYNDSYNQKDNLNSSNQQIQNKQHQIYQTQNQDQSNKQQDYRQKQSVSRQLNFNIPQNSLNLQKQKLSDIQWDLLDELEDQEDNEFQDKNIRQKNDMSQQQNKQYAAQSDKKDQKQQLHINYQITNNSVILQNTINQINQFEQKVKEFKQEQKAKNPQNQSNSEINQINIQSKKRPYQSIQDYYQDIEARNKRAASVNIQQTMQSNVNNNLVDDQDNLNLNETISKKQCNELNKLSNQ